MNLLEARLQFHESQLVKKDELYERWRHATMDEIVELCDNDSLRTYLHIKGPIKGIVYCVPAGGIQSYDNFSDNAHYFKDDHVSYFLLEDVKRCEERYPDFLGNPAIANPVLADDPFIDFTPPDPHEEIPKEKIPNRKVTQLLRVISATEVARRWGLGATNLQEMVNRSRRSQFHHLPVYTSPQKRIRPHDGQEVYFCGGPYYGFPGEWGEYDLEDHYFSTDDVEAYEVAHPEEVWPVVEEEQIEEEPEFIEAEEVRKQLGMSPSRFVEMLSGKNGPRLVTSREDSYLLYCGDRNFFTTDEIEGLESINKGMIKCYNPS